MTARRTIFSGLTGCSVAPAGVLEAEGAQSDDAGSLVDIATALTAASQRLETLAQQQDASATEQAAGQQLEEEAAEEAQDMEEDAREELLLPAELAEPPAEPCPADIQARFHVHVVMIQLSRYVLSDRRRFFSSVLKRKSLRHGPGTQPA